MSRTALAILSTDHLLHNLRIIQRRVTPAKIIAMIKANAYGHGLRSVALRLDQEADMLGVASIDEALALRKIGIKTPILLAEGVFEANGLIVASEEKFHVVFHNAAQIDWLEKSKLPLPLQSWIKVNTGMCRLGFNVSQAVSYYKRLIKHKKIAKPIRVLSHLACADQIDHPLNYEQIQSFSRLTRQIKSEFSLCHSAGIFHFPEHYYDYVRPGIALYGVSPIPGQSAESLNLRPVMTLQTNLISVQNRPKGANIGYGARYQCPEDMPVGVIAFGYGDGYPLTAKDGTPIRVNQTECQLIGRISMDMMSVDLRRCPNAKIGDPVILWGNHLPVERVAAHTENLSWDILTGVQNRVKFLWTSKKSE